MSAALKNTLTYWGTIIGIVAGIFGFIQSYAVLPYRVGENEKAVVEMKGVIKLLQDDTRSTREILIRIEERVKLLQESIDVRR